MRKLLRDHGIVGKKRRRLAGGARGRHTADDADDHDGLFDDLDDGDVAEGSVLVGVSKSEMEAWYQEHMTENDYLDRV